MLDGLCLVVVCMIAGDLVGFWEILLFVGLDGGRGSLVDQPLGLWGGGRWWACLFVLRTGGSEVEC